MGFGGKAAGARVTDRAVARQRRVAFDSTPGDLSPEAPDQQPRDPGRRLSRPRTLFTVLLLATGLLSGLVATGAVDATEHALAHVFPELMLDGCGGG
jgi:hypothetical protein